MGVPETVVLALSTIWNMLGNVTATPGPLLVAVAENITLSPATLGDGEIVVSPGTRSGRHRTLVAQETVFEPPADETITEAFFAPPLAYDVVVLTLVPERLSSPLHE